MPEERPPRSGCAVLFGLLLITLGGAFLTYNVLSFFGLSTVRFAREGVFWYGRYWPLLVIAWGAYKVYDRTRHPDRAHVTAAEIIVLLWVLGLGLFARGVERGVQELSVHVSLDEVAGALGPELLGPAHRFTTSETFELDAASALSVDNRNGRVVVLGTDEPGVRVTLTKRIYSFSVDDAERRADRVQLSFQPGQTARLETTRDEESRSVSADIVVHAPRALSIEVQNRRGSVRVEHVDGPVSVKSTHGAVEVRDLAAGVEAITSHASVRLERIAGGARAETSRGMIYAEHIDGGLSAKTTRQDVTVENVQGDVVLRTRHGSVSAVDIGGDVDIDAPQSEVSVERARGTVTIAGRYGPVFVSDVEGSVKLTTRNANVMVRSVGRDVSVENQYRPVHIAGVSGSVTVDGKQCAVTIESVDGAIGIDSSHEDVTVADFGSSLEIDASHAELDIRTAELSGAVSIETTYGNVALILPASASAALTARAQSGDLESEFSELERVETRDETSVLQGSLGSGAHPVTIETSYSDVVLRRGTP